MENEPRPRLVSRDKWGMDSTDAVGDQLARFGITAYVELGGNVEGQMLPSGAEDNTGIEDVSVDLVASNGNVYDVWLRWNPNKTAPDGSKGYYELESFNFSNETFVPWVEGQPIPIQGRDKGDAFSEGSFYIQSRKLLGVPVTKKQEEILEDFLLAHPYGKDTAGNRIRGLKKTATILNQPPAKSDN